MCIRDSEQVGQGLFRGIRHSISRADHPEVLTIPGRAPAGIAQDPRFLDGLRTLGTLGYSYDCWLYHDQIRDFAAMADAAPDTTMVLDHFGTPLGVGPFAGKRAEIFEQWKVDVEEIAKCDNVVAKLGGMAMPDNGFGWDTAASPPTSDEFVDAQAPYYHHMIACFGTARCMFESNFPVDRWSLSYKVLWNGLKKIAAEYPESQQQDLFSETARRIYRI